MSIGGFSRARLERMHEVMAGHVERGAVPGLVTRLSRRGEVHVDAIGTKAIGGSDPMRRDTVFRIASMTKPLQGRYGSERLLSRLSVELMTSDHITPEQKAASPFFPGFWDARGWGFGMSIITRRENLAAVPGRFGWDGGYGTSGYCDPEEDMVAILMTQRVWDSPIPPPVYLDFWTSAYQAIDD
jgi:CubicO group peptidase (beta-lactamase class C family)